MIADDLDGFPSALGKMLERNGRSGTGRDHDKRYNTREYAAHPPSLLSVVVMSSRGRVLVVHVPWAVVCVGSGCGGCDEARMVVGGMCYEEQ